MEKRNTRTLALIVSTITYLLVGAAVFDALESETEKKKSGYYFDEEQIIRTKYNMTDVDFNHLRRNIIQSVPYKAGTQWEFAGAFYFALIVITTIGYGHITPQTDAGKIVCMIYALIGIQLCNAMYKSVGERLNIFVTYIMKKGKKCLRLKKTEVGQTELKIVTLSLSLIVLMPGAAAFMHFERWAYIDALYYCFITLTTIGFGDFVALQKNNALEEQPHYVTFSILFILFGLTVISAAINLLEPVISAAINLLVTVISAAINLLVLRFLTTNTKDERRDELETVDVATTVTS